MPRASDASSDGMSLSALRPSRTRRSPASIVAATCASSGRSSSRFRILSPNSTGCSVGSTASTRGLRCATEPARFLSLYAAFYVRAGGAVAADRALSRDGAVQRLAALPAARVVRHPAAVRHGVLRRRARSASRSAFGIGALIGFLSVAGMLTVIGVIDNVPILPATFWSGVSRSSTGSASRSPSLPATSSRCWCSSCCPRPSHRAASRARAPTRSRAHSASMSATRACAAARGASRT